jgi:hypothetical protein
MYCILLLTSAQQVVLRFIYVVACISASHPWLPERYFMIWKCTTFCLCMYCWWTFVLTPTLIYSWMMSLCALPSFFLCSYELPLPLEYIPKGLTILLYGKCVLNYLRNCWTIYQSRYTILEKVSGLHFSPYFTRPVRPFN